MVDDVIKVIYRNDQKLFIEISKQSSPIEREY